MVEQRLEVIVCGFRSYQICLLGIGLILYFSIEDFRSDPDIKTVDSKLQNSIIQNSYRFGTLLTISGIISFVAAAGLSFRRKFGWYAAVSLVIIQIVAITGLLDRERVTHFILLPEIKKTIDFRTDRRN